MKLCVSKRYGEKCVFDRFTLDIQDGEVLCLLGRSGVGKTTLLKILAGLTDFDGTTDGVPDKVGFVFQEPRLLPYATVKENLIYSGADEREIAPVLEKLGLSAYANTRADRLSGGEKQRVAIARAFLSNASLMLLDEPFSSLDLAWKTELWQAFATLWEEKKRTAVIVTHDIEDAWALGHRIVLIRDGEVVLDIRPDRNEYPAPYGQVSTQKSEIIKTALDKEWL